MKLSATLGLDLPRLEPGTPGDPGLFGPRSAVWRIGRERALLLGGPAALLLQIAHPLVAEAVANHSEFRRDPFERLRATLDATLRIAFGDTRQAHAAAERVRRTHRRVRGRMATATGPLPAGTPYAADDPDLAMWVHATLVWSALEVYDRFIGRLSEDDRTGYYEESKRFAALFGAIGTVVPATYDAFAAYFDRKVDDLWVGPSARSLSTSILDPPVPWARRVTARTIETVTAGLLPSPIRDGYGLSWTPGVRRLCRIQRWAVHVAVRSSPSSVRYWPHYLLAVHRAGSSG